MSTKSKGKLLSTQKNVVMSTKMKIGMPDHLRFRVISLNNSEVLISLSTKIVCHPATEN